MHTTTDHINEGCDQTADMLNHASEKVADTLTDAGQIRSMRAQTSFIT